jgi:hypothetical protein
VEARARAGEEGRDGPFPRPRDRTRSTDAAQAQDGPGETVHVSIGRIEVRAIMPAPESKPPAAPVPRMSLDEYLEKHAGRRSR